MRPVALAGVVMLILAGPARPAAPTTAATAPAPSAARRPPARGDLLTGPLDPYQPVAERGRFFRTVGVDNELDAKEFAAARGRDGTFVRPFDRWEAMAAFDKDKNGTLDWFEADAYRQDVRRRVLKAFDEDKDGRLTGKERDKANAMLASGRLPADEPGGRRGPGPGPGRNGEGERTPDWMRERMLRQRQELLGRYDADRDGRLAEAERQAMLEGVRKEAEREVLESRRRQWDTDGDGRLNEAEERALRQAADEARQRTGQWDQQRDLRRWDADGDGRLDEKETAAMEAEKTRWREQGEDWRKQWEMRQYDLNDDGRLDEQEQALADAARARQEAYAEQERMRGPGPAERERWQQVVAGWRLKHFDENGDGRLSEGEESDAKEFERGLRDVGQGFRQRMTDLNGDGEVSEEERTAVRQEWQKASWKVFTRTFRYMDADGDGQISLTERRDFTGRIQTGMAQYIERQAERYDADRNGRLDPREREAVLVGVRKEFDGRLARFDANRDGRLSVDEAIEMMEAFVQELGIRPTAPPDARPPERRE